MSHLKKAKGHGVFQIKSILFTTISHGLTSIDPMLMGSATEKVVCQSRCNVFIVEAF
jgi:hypothetical protein